MLCRGDFLGMPPLNREDVYEKGRPEAPFNMRWSGQRGSNPRPQPWQGCALPTEPCPLARKYYTGIVEGPQALFRKTLRAAKEALALVDTGARRSPAREVPPRCVYQPNLAIRSRRTASNRSNLKNDQEQENPRPDNPTGDKKPGGEARIRTGGKGFAGLCLTTWPLRRE